MPGGAVGGAVALPALLLFSFSEILYWSGWCIRLFGSLEISIAIWALRPIFNSWVGFLLLWLLFLVGAGVMYVGVLLMHVANIISDAVSF